MAALLSLRSVISKAEGSAMRTQIVLSAAGIGHMSVLARTGFPRTSMTLACRGTWRSEASLTILQEASRRQRNCDQLLRGTG